MRMDDCDGCNPLKWKHETTKPLSTESRLLENSRFYQGDFINLR